MVNKATLNILDASSDITVFSERELDFSDGFTAEFISKHIDKAFADYNKKSGLFLEDSPIKPLAEKLRSQSISFIEFSKAVVKISSDVLKTADELRSFDIIAADYTKEDAEYIVLLFLGNKTACTHAVKNDEGSVFAEIIRHHAILPTPSQKADGCAIIDLRDLSVGFNDFRQSTNGEQINVLQDKILVCSAEQSQRAVLKKVTKLADKIAEEFGSSGVQAVSEVKSFVFENAESSDELDTAELGRKVFAQSPPMRERFEKEIQKENIPQNVPMEKGLAFKSSKSQKIKTDTGIEIIFPPGYYDNSQYMQFINNPDGTISIEIKNIGKISGKY